MAEDRKKGSKGTKKPGEKRTGTPLPAGFTVQDTTALPRTAQQYIPRPPQLRGSDSDEERADTLSDPATARIPLAPEERHGAIETVDLGRVPTQPFGTVTQPFYGFQREPASLVPFTEVFEETSGDIGALVVDESRSLTPAAPEPTQSFAVRDVRPSIPPSEGIVLEVKATPADPDLPYALTVAAEEPGTREYNRMADVRIRDTARLETPREDHPAHRKTPAVQLVPDPSPKEHILNRGIVYDALHTLYQQSDVLASALRDSQLPDRLYIAQQRFWKGQFRQPELLLQYLVNHPDVRESGLSDELRGFLDVMSYERERKQQMVAAETAGEIPAVRTAVAEPELPPLEHPRHPLLLPPDLTLQRTGVEEFRGPEDLEGYQPGTPQEMIGTPLVGTFTPTSGETGVHAMPVEQPAQPVQPLAAELAGEPTRTREVVSGLKPLPFGEFYEEAVRAGEMGTEELNRALQGVREREALPAEQEVFSLQVIPPRPSVSPDFVRIIDETLSYLHRGTREVQSPPAIKYLTDGKARQREERELFAFLDGVVERVEGETREHQRFCDDIERLMFGIDMPNYPIPMGIERQRIAGEGDYFYLGRYFTVDELTRLSEAVWRLRRIKNQQEGAEREQERRKRTLEGFFGPREKAAEKSRTDRAFFYLLRALEHEVRVKDPRLLADDFDSTTRKKTIRQRRLEEYGAALRDLHTVWKLRPDTPFLQRKRIGYTTEILDLMDHAEQEGDVQSYRAGIHALEYREGNWDLIAEYTLNQPRTQEREQRALPKQRETYVTLEALSDAIQESRKRLTEEYFWEQHGVTEEERETAQFAYEFVSALTEQARADAQRLLPAPAVSTVQHEADIRDMKVYRPEEAMQLAFEFPVRLELKPESILTIGIDRVLEIPSEPTIPVTDAEIIESVEVAAVQTEIPSEEAYVLTDAVVDSIMPLEEKEITADEVPMPTHLSYQEVIVPLLAEVRETEAREEGRQALVDLIATIIPRRVAEEAYHHRLLEAYLTEERKQKEGEQFELDFTGSLARAQKILERIPAHAPEEMYSVTLVTDRPGNYFALFKIDDLVLYGDPNSGKLTRLPQGMPQLHWVSHERLEKEEVARVLQHYANTKPAQFAKYIGNLLGVKGERQISQLPRVSQEEQRTDTDLEVIPLTEQDIEIVAPPIVSPPPLPARVLEPRQLTPQERAYLATFDERVAWALEGRDYDAVMDARKVFIATVRSLEAVEESRRVRALPAPQHREANISVYHPQQAVPAYVAQPAVRTLVQIVDQSLRIMNSGRAVEEIKYQPSGDPTYAAFEHAIMQRDWYASAQQETALIAERLEVLARQKEERQTIVDLMGVRIAQLEADPTLYFREQGKRAMEQEDDINAMLWYLKGIEIDLNDAQLWKSLGHAYYRKGDSEKGTWAFEQAIRAKLRKAGTEETDLVDCFKHLSDKDRDALFCYVASASLEKGKEREVKEAYKQLLSTTNDTRELARYSNMIAYYAHKQGQIIEAVQYLTQQQQFLEQLDKGVCRFILNELYDLTALKEEARLVVARHLADANYALQEGERYATRQEWYDLMGDPDQNAAEQYHTAKENFKEVLRYHPEHEEAKAGVADLEAKLSELGQRQKAKAEEKPEQPDADYYFDRGLKAHEKERLLPAEMWYKAALKADPEHVLTLTNLGLIALEQGEYDRSLELQLKAIDAAANKAEVPEGTEKSADKLDYAPAVVKLHLADAHAAKEDATKATDTYKRILKDHAGTAYEVDAFMSLAEVARSKGDTTMAMHYLDDAREAAEQLGMRTHQIDYNLGVLLQQRGHVESARASYEDAVEGSPKGQREPTYENRSSRLVEGFALNNLGVLAEGRDAQEYFARAMQVNPSNVLAMINQTLLQ